jgi:hypothetical protein
VQVDEMLTTARSLSEYYRAVQDDRTNRTLYILTLVTSIFVPAQFLTGLYGALSLSHTCFSISTLPATLCPLVCVLLLL